MPKAFGHESKGGVAHGEASYNAAMATLAATDLRPRRLVIDHLSLTIEGRALEDVQLGGWVFGPELGTAPAVLIVGGITASPFPFGDGQSSGDDPSAARWAALSAPGLGRRHRCAVSFRRRQVKRRRPARGVVAGARRAGSDRSREVHGVVPVV